MIAYSRHRRVFFLSIATVGLLLTGSADLLAQQVDSAQKPKQNYSLLPQDTLNAGIVDKYILSELEKVQYATYSESLKEEALRRVLENQRLNTVGLEQKLLTEQLKAEATRKQAEIEAKQAEADAKQAEAKQKQAVQQQQIKQLEITQLNQRVVLQNRTRNQESEIFRSDNNSYSPTSAGADERD